MAGYLAAENFKQLGQQDKVKITWTIAIGVTIAIFAAVFLVPAIQKVPNYIIPLIYALIAQFLVKRFQGTEIKTHIENGGQAYSVWRAVWIGLIGAVVLVAVIFMIILFLDKNYLQ